MKMLEDLEEVVRLWGAAEEAKVYGTDGEFYVADKAYADKAAIYIATHHATIRDMASRLEAAERDAARYRWIKVNVTERLTDASSTGNEFAEHKTQYVLPKLIAWADFCGPITLDEAVDGVMHVGDEE